MQHKILVLIEYDKKEYECYLTGFIKENGRDIVGYPIAESADFLEHMIQSVPDFANDDKIDLYLAWTDSEIPEELELEFQNALKRIEKNMEVQTQWDDEEAYDILKEILNYREDRMVLFGRNQTLGHQDEDSIKVFNWCHKDMKDMQEHDKELKSVSCGSKEKIKETKASGQTAPLSKLMRQLAEGGNI